MQPGVDRLPEWVQAIAGILLLGIIFVGGYWLQQKEKKDRAAEKERLAAINSNKDS
jgi:hypothetical protein